MADREKQILNAQRELEKLQRCLNTIEEWPEGDE
jgi:hypothetical protein